MTHQVITIARQAGSGGREIGKRLAKELNIAYYDNELITIAAKESGMSEKLFENIDKAPTTSLLFSVAMGGWSNIGQRNTYSGVNIRDKAFYIQADIIRSIAEKEPCVIIGRCANYILNRHSGLLSVFVHADFDWRAERVADLYGKPKEEIEKNIAKTDKQRASLYNYYTNCTWGDIKNYSLAIDRQRFDIDSCVDIIKTALQAKN